MKAPIVPALLFLFSMLFPMPSWVHPLVGAEPAEAQLLKNYNGPSGLAIAVLPPVIEAGSQNASADLQARRGRMLELISRDSRFRLVERENLDQVLKEQNLQQSGLVNLESATSIGQLAAADLVLTIRKTQAGVEYRILNVATAQIFAYALDRPSGKQRDPSLTPRLLAAVLEGKPEEVASLLAGGADPDGRRADGLPIPFIAIMKDRPDLVQLLLDGGAKTEFADPQNEAIHIPLIAVATMQGNVETARVILKRDPRVIFDRKKVGAFFGSTGDEKASAMETAAASGKLDMLRLLTDYGAPVNAFSLKNAAGSYNRLYVRGVTSSLPGFENFTLRHGDRKEFTSFIETMIDRVRYFSCSDGNPMNEAFLEIAGTLHPDFLRKIRSIGLYSCANVQSSSSYAKGNTPLHAVIRSIFVMKSDGPGQELAKKESFETLQLLLENSADPNLQNAQGEDPVLAGIKWDVDAIAVDAVLFIIDHTRVDYACRKDAQGETALDRARENAHFKPQRYEKIIQRLTAVCKKN